MPAALTKTEILTLIRDVLRDHPEVQSLEIYGSVARGEHRNDSDVDLLVEYDQEASKRGDRRILTLDHDMEAALGMPVSIANKRTLTRRNLPLLHYIQPELETVYERA